MNLSEGKKRRIEKTANQNGVIAAVAVDHREPMRNAMAAARGVSRERIDPGDLSAFKSAAAKVFSRYSSAVLLDPEYSLGAVSQVSPGAGVLLAYETSGYDDTRPGHRPLLLPAWSARRLMEAGADAIKLLLHYSPFERDDINREKQALVERVGAECAALDVPFFLELVAYQASGGENPLEAAARKPEVVTRAIAEFTQDRYGADVLKVEIPFVPRHVEGMRAFAGTKIWTRAEARAAFWRAADAATRPFIYLSGGVSHEVFAESLELAVESAVNWCGVLCGRALWQDGIAVYARRGAAALDEWLETRGVEHFRLIAQYLDEAHPWHAAP